MRLAAAVAFLSGALGAAQLPLEPSKDSGQSITAAYEGWYRNPDGTFSLLVGYFNRNLKQTPDIPVGPDNRIEPGGPDRGQPTHFLTRRQWGVFTIVVPADFGENKLTWTILANGQTTSVPMGLNPLWEVEPFKDAAQGNTPPVLRCEPEGTPLQGPPHGFCATLAAKAAEPLEISLWARDDARVDPDRVDRKGPPVTVFWSKFRGPGKVTFDPPKPEVDLESGKAMTKVTFGAPGDYVLRVQANDVSGEGGSGFQCCWTSAHLKVTVAPAP